MDREQHALVFAPTSGDTPVLNAVLLEIRMKSVSPGEFSNSSGEVSVVVVDRVAAQAVKICANLRKEPRFQQVPILVLLEGAEKDELSRLSELSVDILFKPVAGKALHRYLMRRAPRAVSDDSEARIQDAARGSGPKQPGAAAVPGAEFSLAVEPPASETARTSIQDIIPVSNRLLRQVDAAMALTGAAPCAKCGRWDCRRDDRFCARCGGALAVLEIADERLTLEPLGDHQVGALVELINAGQNPVLLGFQVTGLDGVAGRFRVTPEEGVLYGDSSADLLVTLDARGLDLTNRYRASLEITSNDAGGHKRRSEIVVEPLAIPVIVPHPSYQYAIGGSNEWEFNVANKGGGVLKLNRASIEAVEMTPACSLVVRGGDSMAVRFIVPQLDVSAGFHQRAMTWDFGPHGSLTTALTIEAIRPPRLTVQPPELDFGVVSTGREARLPLSFVNSGEEDLVVEAIILPVEWAECSVAAPIRVSKSTQVVEVQIRGSEELEGDHAGEIAVYSNSYREAIRTIPFRVRFVIPEPYQEYIGIDFGTSGSCVAVLDSNKRPVVIELEPGSQADPRIMPSALYFHGDGAVTVGREALAQAIIQPVNAVTSIKRALGMKGSRTFGGREYSPTEMASEVIKQLVRLTEGGLFKFGEYKTPHRAVVTTPVEFLTNQRSALLDACKLTGLTMDSSTPGGIVIDEAHAAALYYLTKRASDDGAVDAERLLIFDFGGGTLDCALIDVGSAGGKILVKTLAPGGDPKLGGDDIDWALAQQLGLHAIRAFPGFDIDCLSTDEKRFNHKFRAPAMSEAANSSRATFKRQAESAKISLSGATEVEVVVEPLLSTTASLAQPFVLNGHGRARLTTRLHKHEVEQVVRPFVDRAVEVIEGLCEKAGVSPGSVSTILHVGRTSLIPVVRQTINRALPNAIDRSDLIEPKLCVALGAAYWGYIKGRPHADVEFIGVTDQMIHDLGYLDVRGVKEIFVPVFPAYTEIPCGKTVEFPRRDEIVLRLAENRGRARVEADKTVEIGVVRIDGRAAGSTVPVTFHIDENRVLEITANGTARHILEVGEP